MRKIFIGVLVAFSFIFGLLAPVGQSWLLSESGVGFSLNQAEAKKKTKKKKNKKKKKKKTKKKKTKKTSKETKLANFTKSLVTDGDSQRIKVEKVYRWITANIDYDYDKLNGKTKRGKNTPYETYSTKKGVCTEYAELLEDMLDTLGIRSYVVSGEAYNGQKQGDHSWNSIKIDGQTLYMDATWDEDDDTFDYFLIPERCININHDETETKNFTESGIIDYINADPSYFDQYCSELKSRFVD